MKLEPSPAIETARPFRIGDWLVNPSLDEISRIDQVVKLEPRMVRLLARLAQQPGEVVSTQELLDFVWADVVVGPASVYQAISHLRKLLGDTGATPTYITTVPKKGYRLIATVRPLEPEKAVVAVPAAPSGRKRAWAWAGALLGALVIGASMYFWPKDGDAPSAPPQNTASSTTSLQDVDSQTLVVLPFDHGGVREDPRAAIALTEMVRMRLAMSSSHTVIARYSAASAKSLESDFKAAASRVRARYALLGVVRQAKSTFHAELRLVDVLSDTELWATSMDRPIAGLGGAAEGAARAVASRLQMKYRPAQVDQPVDFDVFLIYLRGLSELEKETLEGNGLAQAQFARSIALDPGFARGHMGLGIAAVQESVMRRHWEPKVFNVAYQSLERALELDPDLGEAWTGKALYLYYKKDEAERAHARALELTPNDADGYRAFAGFLAANGRLDEAKQMMDRARRIDPLATRHLIAKSFLVMSWEGDTAEQERLARQALALDPNLYVALNELARIRHYWHGEFAQSVQYIERALKQEPLNPISSYYGSMMYLDLGDLESALSLGDSRIGVMPDVQIALYRGDHAQAARLAKSSTDLWQWSYGLPSLAQAVRDHAIAAGELEDTVAYFDQLLGRMQTFSGPQRCSVTLVLAHVKLRLGRKPEAESHARACLKDMDAEAARMAGTWSFGRLRSYAYVILGKYDEAIAELENAQSLSRHAGWWYLGERDPLFEPLRDLPRFRALAARSAAHRQSQVRLLEDLRQNGQMPRHSTKQRAEAAVR